MSISWLCTVIPDVTGERGEQVKGTQGLSVLLFITIPHKSIIISKQEALKSP